MNWFESEFKLLENPLSEVILFLAILALGLIFKRFGAWLISKQSYRIFKAFSKDKFSEVFVDLLRKPIEQFLLILIVYFAFNRLCFPASWNLEPASTFGLRWALLVVWQIAFFVILAKILIKAIDFFTYVLIHRDEAPFSPELGHFLKELFKVVVVVLIVFTALRVVFSINITALVASLGIGGLAVALAAQDTLANLLGSFIIYLDKPFKAGDLIEAGEIKGTIEHVGFRTTRVRTMEKSLLTVPNKKLIDGALNNITQSEARRVKFSLQLTYKSRSTQIQNIIQQIKQALSNHADISDDFTVRFTDFDTSSLNILVIYFVKSNEYEKMITVKEQINFSIMQIVTDAECEFAFPTQTVYLNR